MHQLAILFGSFLGNLIDPIVAIVSILTGLAVRNVAVLYVGPIVVGLLIITLNSALRAQQQLSAYLPPIYYLGIFLACAAWIAAGWFVRKLMKKKEG